MTFKDLIQFILTELPLATNKEIADVIGSKSPAYISTLTKILFENDILDRMRVGKAFEYILKRERVVPDQFKEFTYTLRISGTNKKGSKHAWETQQNLEAGITGTVPINFTEDQVKEKIKDDLFETTRQILDDKGVLPKYKIDGSIAVDDDDIIWGDADRGISGIEFGDTKEKYDSNVEIEVMYRNVEGTLYDKGSGFSAKAQKTLDEWIE